MEFGASLNPIELGHWTERYLCSAAIAVVVAVVVVVVVRATGAIEARLGAELDRFARSCASPASPELTQPFN